MRKGTLGAQEAQYDLGGQQAVLECPLLPWDGNNAFLHLLDALVSAADSSRVSLIPWRLAQHFLGLLPSLDSSSCLSSAFQVINPTGPDLLRADSLPHVGECRQECRKLPACSPSLAFLLGSRAPGTTVISHPALSKLNSPHARDQPLRFCLRDSAPNYRQ